ncbi:MAG: ATP-binding protein [Bacteroidales bacterium]
MKQDISQHTTDKQTFFDIYEVTKNDKRVLIFHILPAPKGTPISWKGVRYARNGESLTVLSDAKIDIIRNQCIKEDWSAKIVEDADIDDLDGKAILKARELYIKKHPDKAEEMLRWDDITFLNKAKVTRKGKITNTAIILLGKEESEVLISPAVAKIRWILKDSKGIERDYVIKSCPFVLAIDEIYGKIRNLKYRYINPYLQTLFPEELDTYDPYIIREAINNAIAHQDYNLSGVINVMEFDDKLIFTNKGSFIPKDIQSVLDTDAPEEEYRNRFLANAMVELNMVDTIGSGIRKMFNAQLRRLFPMPDYDFSDNKIQVTIVGHILDLDYSMLLEKHKELSLSEIEMLNRVLFRKALTTTEVNILRKKKLIEGRKPNFFLSKTIASVVDQKVEYTRNKGLDDSYCKKLIIEAVRQHKTLSRKEIDKLLVDKLPEILTSEQKLSKIKNILSALRKDKKIKPSSGRLWVLDEV